MLPERGRVKLWHKAIISNRASKIYQKEVDLCIAEVCSKYEHKKTKDFKETTQHSKELNIGNFNVTFKICK